MSNHKLASFDFGDHLAAAIAFLIAAALGYLIADVAVEVWKIVRLQLESLP